MSALSDIRIIIAGSRSIKDWTTIKTAIEGVLEKWDIPIENVSAVVSGHAQGVDMHGELWAKMNRIPVVVFAVQPYEWVRFGKSAGHKRNARMADYGNHLIAIWDGNSRGTEGMVELAKLRGLKYEVVEVKNG
jgi:hypothetical protein